MEAGGWQEALGLSNAKYVIIGIPEDIGVRANLGKGGADTAWLPFLSAFVNTQSNDFLSGENVLMLGHFDFGDVKYLIDSNAYNQEELIDAYRHAVNIIDEAVEGILKVLASAGKIPVIIGGGHNNAYPIIKAIGKGLQKAGLTESAQLSCINVDAQADYRPTEGRHSGNSFRYALEEGFLAKYSIIGLHESYVSQNVLTEIHGNAMISYTTYEDIFIRKRKISGRR